MMVGVDRRERPEALGEAHLRLLVQVLPAQHDHQMLVPRIPDAGEGRLIERPRDIDAADLGAERARQLHDFH